jgi:p-aminobenzoyl-glutamate transporter AbgT
LKYIQREPIILGSTKTIITGPRRGSTWRMTAILARADIIAVAMYGAIGIIRATATSTRATGPMIRPAVPLLLFLLFLLVLPINRLNGCR